MDVIAWLWWALVAVVGALWSVLWFLLAGWVATLLQIALLIMVVYFLKYGWQRAPAEIWRRTRSFARFFWNWLRAREPKAAPDVHAREIVRVVKVKELGDINISTLLSLLMVLGFALLTGL